METMPRPDHLRQPVSPRPPARTLRFICRESPFCSSSRSRVSTNSGTAVPDPATFVVLQHSEEFSRKLIQISLHLLLQFEKLTKISSESHTALELRMKNVEERGDRPDVCSVPREEIVHRFSFQSNGRTERAKEKAACQRRRQRLTSVSLRDLKRWAHTVKATTTATTTTYPS